LRIESIVSSTARMKQLRDARDADVEPHRAVEGGALGDEDVAQLLAERGLLLGVDEVAALPAPRRDRVDHPVDDLAQRRLAPRRAEGPPEVLLGDDVRRVDRPRHRELHPELLEGDRAVLPVRDPRVAPLPHDLVVGVDPGRGEQSAETDAEPFRCE
jgi:hypothetical protein